MPRPYHPPSPYQAPVSGNIDQRLSEMAVAISRKAEAGMPTTAVPFVGLLAPDGSTWKLSIDATGALHTELVPRT